MKPADGARGWDEYAAFYDWENARTLGRRDVPFWTRVALQAGGPVLELGCGTGRILAPLSRAGVPIVGIDRSQPMLARAQRRLRRPAVSAPVVRGDIRALPFRSRAFDMVIAPYGMLQSLTREQDLRATLAAVADVLRRRGLFGVDLVPDLPRWPEYRDRVTLRGRDRSGAGITLRESVAQDRRRGLTTFDQVYTRRAGRERRTRRFSLVFRTLSVRQIEARLARAGFAVEAVLGDYHGGPWDPRADVWIILARRD
ncbi:MAG TPA: class I SAM-dependent methyltransferase [Vicinamibacterales bacterium]|nr:class I SAM-dependent methyltransferase [Vicinamibacterales bacterium]